MSEDTTDRLNDGGSFEARVLRALAAINGRLDSMDNRLTTMDVRLTTMDSRLTTTEVRLTALEEKVGGVESRLGSLGEKVDARLRETRPIWESVLTRLVVIDEKFDVHAHDMPEMRADINMVEKRVPPAA